LIRESFCFGKGPEILIIVATLARINRNEIGIILSKYNIPSLNLSQYAIKSRMWEHFVDAASDSGKISVL